MAWQNEQGTNFQNRIRNKQDLLKGTQANQQARLLALELLEVALAAVEPRYLVQQALNFKNNTLTSMNHQIALDDVDGIYVVGAGKASGRMAEGLESILGTNITDGLIIVPEKTVDAYSLEHIKILGGGHPIPTEQSVRATKEILTFIRKTPSTALILSLISGGGSSLFCLPVSSLTLQDLQKTTQLLLDSGVPIGCINTVRKHLSQVKGGNFALHVHPRKHWVLLISDVPGDQLEMIASGPTLPDSTFFQTVTKIFYDYQLWTKIPWRVRDHIFAGVIGEIDETPKPNNPLFNAVINQLIGCNDHACEAAFLKAQQSGFKAQILTTACQGEARKVGTQLGGLALELIKHKAPAIIIVGSETTVTIQHSGKGGRNTELVTAALPLLQNRDGLVLASLATDGEDGPTEFAGAIADGASYNRAIALNLSPEDLLKKNDTYTLFRLLSDHIYTGPTHTNVRDISIIISSSSQDSNFTQIESK